MGAHPEQKAEHHPETVGPVTWIGRDRVPNEPETGSEGGPRSFLAERFTGEDRSKWIAGSVALIVLLVALLLWATQPWSAPGGGQAGAVDQSIPVVSVSSPGLSAVTSKVSFTGTLSARYDMPIGVEGEGGRITRVYVEAGDRVKRGQLLAKLDDSVLQPQLNRLAASLEEARAQAALSQAEYRRAQGVEAAGALSAEEIERRRATAVTDEARVRVAAAQLAEMQARLDRTEVRAPAEGLVLTRNAEVGQSATPGGDPLFRLAAGGEVEMRGQVAEQDLPALEVGQPASVYLTGIAEPFEGRVRLLGAIIDPQSRLGEIRVALEPDPALRPGAFARGEVSVSQAQRPVLPQTAVLSDAKGTFVYIVNGDSEVERREVRVSGTVPEGIVITSGLEGDEQIITTAGGFLREGEKVAVAQATSGAQAASRAQ